MSHKAHRHALWYTVMHRLQWDENRGELAFKRTGITHPARLYGRIPEEIDPSFDDVMQRLWDLGTIDATGRADTELRRSYLLT
jgi:hypothetical protein